MPDWLSSALDYIPRWIEYQLRHLDQPGVAIAVAERGRIVFDEAFGIANAVTGEKLTPRHRFRVASHSKTFTAAGIMALRERGRLRLDDPVGTYVDGLHPAIAAATLGQLLSHSAGLVRDGDDAGQFMDRRPYRIADEIRADLAAPPPLEAALRFKYSNHGYALLGLVIERVAGEAYLPWIRREIVAAAGLEETLPDMPPEGAPPLASGHTTKLPFGRRLPVPGGNATNALAAAAGFVSTARDLALFFGKLAPEAEDSFLSSASRREMTRPHWRDPDTSLERHYGLGTISGKIWDLDWFGHSGSFQGFITRTVVFPKHRIALAVLTNAVDGFAHFWVDGIAHMLKVFAERGAPDARSTDWTGRWWSLWGASDLVRAGDKVLVALPAMLTPLLDAQEIELVAPDQGKIVRASGFNSFGEAARLVRDEGRAPRALWLGGMQLLPEDVFSRELEGRYGPRV